MRVSIVSPFYNEELILRKSVELMITNLSRMLHEWEFIIVNDGSTDKSLKIAEELLGQYQDRLRVISYPVNQGRGHALKQGIDAAKGDYIITTEIDSSWGDEIVQCLLRVVEQNPAADIVIASPHLPGGNYKNVPMKRVLLSSLGNKLIRLLFTKDISMFTGMTRAYKASIIKTLPVTEKEKEFHLEVVMKAMAFGYKIIETPCVLEWKDHKLQQPDQAPKKRKSSSKINKLIGTHLLFGIMAKPVRYLWGIGAGLTLVGVIFFILALIQLIFGKVAIFFALSSASLMIIAMLFFIFGVLSTQNSMIQKDLWRIQQEINALKSDILTK